MSQGGNSTDKKLYVLGGAVLALIIREVLSYYQNKTNKTTSDKYVNNSLTPKQQVNKESCQLIGAQHPYSSLKEKYQECVYMDYNATTPVWPEVTEVMIVSI